MLDAITTIVGYLFWVLIVAAGGFVAITAFYWDQLINNGEVYLIFAACGCLVVAFLLGLIWLSLEKM